MANAHIGRWTESFAAKSISIDGKSATFINGIDRRSSWTAMDYLDESKHQRVVL